MGYGCCLPRGGLQYENDSGVCHIFNGLKCVDSYNKIKHVSTKQAFTPDQFKTCF